MTGRWDGLGLAAAVFAVLALALPLGVEGAEGAAAAPGWSTYPAALAAVVAAFAAGGLCAFRGAESAASAIGLLAVTAAGALSALAMLNAGLAGQAGWGFWLFILSLWALVWRGVDGLASYETLSRRRRRAVNLAVPAAFGLWVLFIWETLCAGFDIPRVLLPPPSDIFARFAGSLGVLWDDFVQTFMKSVLSGYAIGCGAGFITAILVDRVPFLKRGLLPLGNMVSALPIIGVAPIMVMWFGFDWQSKAAVVVIMTFFPMLVNTVTGLSAASALEMELMRSYGAGYMQTLLKLRLQAAMPFIFNALKINSTLALIGAIVAEFFGTPIVGMGFRISTEVGRMNVDMVWAEILVAALAGSAFYGVMAMLERAVTFWHPSYRTER